MCAMRRWCLVSVLLVLCVAGCGDEPVAPDALALFRVTEAPSGIEAVAGSPGRIDVRWQDNSSNETGFELGRSSTGAGGPFVSHTTTGPNVTSFGDAAVVAGREYCYQVRAFRTTGRKTTYSAYSAAACATAPPAVEAPSNVEAKPPFSSAVDITWRDNSSFESGFRLERAATSGGPWVLVVQTSSGVTSHRDWERASEQQVCYRVIAFNSFGDSEASNVDCTAPPAPPANLAATAPDAQSVVLTWEDKSGVEDGYEIQRSLGNGLWSVVATVAANVIIHRDAGLVANTRYWYQVRALKDGGGSHFSNYADALVAGTPPGVPTETAATPIGSSSVSVSWASQPNVDGFRVERSISGGPWELVGTSPWNQPSLFDSPVASETAVCYRVRAFNGQGESGPSDAACTAPPAAPTNLVATPVDGDPAGPAIELTWTDNSGAEDGYEVWRLVDDCYYYYYCYPYWAAIATLGPNATSYRDTGLAGGFWYTYLVIARKDGGYSDASAEAGAATNP